MIKVEKVEVFGYEAAIRGMRNPMNSWDKSDSYHTGYEKAEDDDVYTIMGFLHIGQNDLDLMKRLTKAGTEHRKFLRMIYITMDITAPLYWWKEFDTYKVGTVADSCSTMHKITDDVFTLDDFSCEHMVDTSKKVMSGIIDALNFYRTLYIVWDSAPEDLKNMCGNDKKSVWYQMIQLLPSSYNQKRTVSLNYEVAMNIIRQRSGHKLDEWRTLVDVLKDLPYMKELIGGD